MSNTNKNGRGRPSGSFSFVSVRMEDLAEKVGPKGNVTVSAKFARDLGISAVSAEAAKIHKASYVEEGGVVEAHTVTSTPASQP